MFIKCGNCLWISFHSLESIYVPCLCFEFKIISSSLLSQWNCHAQKYDKVLVNENLPKICALFTRSFSNVTN